MTSTGRRRPSQNGTGRLRHLRLMMTEYCYKYPLDISRFLVLLSVFPATIPVYRADSKLSTPYHTRGLLTYRRITSVIFTKSTTVRRNRMLKSNQSAAFLFKVVALVLAPSDCTCYLAQTRGLLLLLKKLKRKTLTVVSI